MLGLVNDLIGSRQERAGEKKIEAISMVDLL
jgi:hypothetical protein